ncbi:MAG: M15 family metallopeptidase [Cyanobacteria bacterium P01_H01_bin.21]
MSDPFTDLGKSMANFTDDIPEARRETLMASAEPSLAKSPPKVTPWLVLGLAAMGLSGAGIWWLKPGAPAPKAAPPSAAATTGSAVAAQQTVTSANDVSEVGTQSTASDQPGQPNALLGHRPYPIADASNLVTLSTNAMVALKPEVAQKVETMIQEANAAGIRLDAISGFRSLEDQRYLFFDLKAERGQTPETRAEVSAPPGYSEHHTGYAVDFVDLSQPATELETSFEQTPAFRWLEENAAYYGFELSFPKDNNQNVAYEPWHWRYVGNQESLELFYQDRN